jgi:tetratricopeptide (TPR) repeat protein
VTSTVEEWEKMGRILFARGNYQQAIICFDRAEMPLLREISRCYHLRKLARLLDAGSAQRKAAFLEVAKRFSQCAGGEHDQSQRCYLRAGECYAESGRDRKASDAFCNAREFTKGAQHARKAADFDRAAEIVQSHSVDEDVGAAIIAVCRLYFLRQEAFK